MAEANGKAPSMTMIGLGGSTTIDPPPPSQFSLPNLSSLFSTSSNPLSNLFSTTEAETARLQLATLWTSAKPWTQFFNTKKFIPPTSSELRQRLVENIPYFFPNYVLIFIALSMIGVLVHPLSFVALFFIIIGYVYMFLQHPKSLKVGPVVLSESIKVVVFGVLCAGMLYLTNAIAIVGSWAAFSVVVSLAHAGARVSAEDPDFDTPAEQV